MITFTSKDVLRFWTHVTKTDSCWNCDLKSTSSTTNKDTSSGYPNITLYFNKVRKLVKASRFSWILHNGDIPEGLHVLHKCDNPKCVRPDHLFLGTHKDNMADMVAKGRGNSCLSDPERRKAVLASATSKEALAKKAKTYQKIKHQQGTSNSQFGTAWIFNPNTSECLKVSSQELNIWECKGWIRGRRIPKVKDSVKTHNKGACGTLSDADILTAWGSLQYPSLRKVAEILGTNYGSLRNRLKTLGIQYLHSFKCPYRLLARSIPFQGIERGSKPRRDANILLDKIS